MDNLENRILTLELSTNLVNSQIPQLTLTFGEEYGGQAYGALTKSVSLPPLVMVGIYDGTGASVLSQNFYRPLRLVIPAISLQNSGLIVATTLEERVVALESSMASLHKRLNNASIVFGDEQAGNRYSARYSGVVGRPTGAPGADVGQIDSLRAAAQ